MKERWARLGLDGAPKDIDANAWWYEDPAGIDVHVEPSTEHRTLKIPATSLRAYLRRLERGLQRHKKRKAKP